MRNLCEYLIYDPSTSINALRASKQLNKPVLMARLVHLSSVPRSNRLHAKQLACLNAIIRERYNRTLAVFEGKRMMPEG